LIYEHEIPSLSRLYFGKSAKLKRDIETTASKILYEKGYEEIVTPIFSYHQHQNISEKELIRFSDKQNNIISLRADSTLDVVRIINKRLGRSIDQKKWFYIQPILKFPSSEQYQIGAENLQSSDLSQSINDSVEILRSLNLAPLLQISNINIPKIISKLLDIPLEVFKSSKIEKLLDLDVEWLKKLVYLQNIDQIDDVINEVPKDLKEELQKIKNLCSLVEYNNLTIAPLYYSNMRYYDNLFFRILEKNSILGRGGNYKYKDANLTGFALYTDKIIEELIN
jgi:ATP phosphoribosyltransferase regulatory subunit HisZ